MLQFIGGDPDKDVAVLQLLCPEEKMKDLKSISLGNSSNLLVGQKVFAIGNPFGLDHTLTGQLYITAGCCPSRLVPVPATALCMLLSLSCSLGPPNVIWHAMHAECCHDSVSVCAAGIISGLGRELATPGFRGVPIRYILV